MHNRLRPTVVSSLLAVSLMAVLPMTARAEVIAETMIDSHGEHAYSATVPTVAVCLELGRVRRTNFVGQRRISSKTVCTDRDTARELAVEFCNHVGECALQRPGGQ